MLISFLAAYLGRNELAPILSSISPFLCYQDANIKKPTKKAGISTSMTTTSQLALYKSKLQFSPGYKLAVQNGGVHKRTFDKVKDAFLKTPLGVYFYKHVSVAEMKIFRFLGPTSTFKGWNNQLESHATISWIAQFVQMSFFVSVSGMQPATSANASSLEKRSSSRFDCRRATFARATLHDYLYRYNCIPRGWESFFNSRNVERDLREISNVLAGDARRYTIQPELASIFNAFAVTLRDVKVVILGQDPTPQPNQATGFAFSLVRGVDPYQVPAVFNMLVELGWEGFDVGLSNGDLTPWVRQGVLLLNAALTVRQRSAGSHQQVWAVFTQLVIREICASARPTAFLLWGSEARGAASYISGNHYIKSGGHPSQRSTSSQPFYGRNYFRCANRFLRQNGRSEVDWRLPENRHSSAPGWARC